MQHKNNWNNYKWQINNSIYKIDDLPIDKLLPKEIEAINKLPNKSLIITPYIYSLINFEEESCPIRKQIIPIEHTRYFSDDYLKEKEHLKTPLIVQKNLNRVLFLVSKNCGFNCTFCTRLRIKNLDVSQKLIDESIAYIEKNEQINEVVLSGGDPLFLSDAQLMYIISKLYNIRHVDIIRIGTRMPVSLPMRITDNLINILKEYPPIYMNIHINHPNEITQDSISAFNKLANVGVVLSSQTVLLKNVNDDFETLKKLFFLLLKHRVKPYYLFQCDKENGCEDFIVDEKIGIEIINDLQKHMSGLAVPKYIVDTPEGKIVLGPYEGEKNNG